MGPRIQPPGRSRFLAMLAAAATRRLAIERSLAASPATQTLLYWRRCYRCGGRGQHNPDREHEYHDCLYQGISGKITAGGVAVFVGSDGHLGTMTSSAGSRVRSSRWPTPAKLFWH